MRAVAIVPASGRSERFGSPKLVADVGGEPMIDRTVRSLLDGGVPEVVVVLPPGADFQASHVLSDERVRVATNVDPSRGMFSSIQAGVAAAGPDADPLLIIPADMPFVRPATVRAVLDAYAREPSIVQPTHLGRHGHPIAIPGVLRLDILAADPRSTLKTVLDARPRVRVAIDVDDPGVLRDVDTPRDLEGR